MLSIKQEIISKLLPEGANLPVWLQGKATKEIVIEFLSVALEKLNEIGKEMNEGLAGLHKETKNIVEMQSKEPLQEQQKDIDMLKKQNVDLYKTLRIANLQVSALIRVAAGSMPGDVQTAREKFTKEVMREMDLANFVDSLAHTKGKDFSKTMPEKIDLILAWNASEDPIHVLCDFDPIGIKAFLTENPTTFDDTKMSLIRRTLNIEMDKVEVTNDGL